MENMTVAEFFAMMGIPIPRVPMPGPSCKPARCAMCPGIATRRCNDCEDMYYCSEGCQNDDLRTHKLICDSYKDFMATRPGPNYNSGIVFLPNEPRPRFIWFDRSLQNPTPGQLTEIGFDPEWIKDATHMESANNPILKRHIEPHHIMLTLPSIEKICILCNHDHEPNKSLVSIDEDIAKTLRGAVVAWAVHCQGNTKKDAFTLDLGPMALRHAIDEMKMGAYAHQSILEEAQLKSGDSIVAVRLNCNGDRHVFDYPTMEAVLEPASILIIESEVATPVANRVGLPLVVRKVPPSVVWRDRDLASNMHNPKARMLNPPSQLPDTGSLVIARKDGKPLHPEHLLALDGYTATRLVHPSHPKDACVTSDMLIANRVDQTSRKDFKRWYIHEWKKHHTSSKSIPSPYDDQGLECFNGMPTSLNFSCACCQPGA